MVSHGGNAVVPWVQGLSGPRLAGRWGGRAWTLGAIGDRARGLSGWLASRLEPDARIAVLGSPPERVASALAIIWSGGVVVLDGSQQTSLAPPSRLPLVRRAPGRWVPPARLPQQTLPARRRRIDPCLVLTDGTVLSHAQLVEQVGSDDPVQWLARLLAA